MKKVLVPFLSCFLLFSAFATAARTPVAGTPDKSFSGDGMVTFEAEQSGSGIAETRSGKIVQVRYPGTVARYSEKGRIDRSLGGDGTVRTIFGGRLIRPDDVLVDRKGRIIVLGSCGHCEKGHYSWSSVGRLLPNGRPDRSFAGNGISRPVRTRDFDPGEIAFAPGGRIVAVSSAYRKGSVVVAYRPDGRLDRSFGAAGVRSFPPGSGINGLDTVAVDKAGRIVLGFEYRRENREKLGVARLLPDGRLDRSFSGDGIAAFVVPEMGGGRVTDLTLDRKGRVVGIGANGSLMARFFRLTPKGRLDQSFAGHGIDEIAWTDAYSVSVDPGGRNVVVGMDAPPYGQSSGATIYRFKPNGRHDPKFRYRGALYSVHDHLVDQRGRIVVSGSVWDGPAIVRLRNP